MSDDLIERLRGPVFGTQTALEAADAIETWKRRAERLADMHRDMCIVAGEAAARAETAADALAAKDTAISERDATIAKLTEELNGKLWHWQKRATAAEAQLERARKALEPFAEYGRLAFSAVNIPDSRVEIGIYSDQDAEVTAGDFRAAARALSQDEPADLGVGG